MHEPTLLAPGVLGSYAEAAWERHVRPYLDNPLSTPLKVAILCAALEREDGTASPVHATGLTLLGQDEPVDLAGIWRELNIDPDGQALLRATIAAGQRRPVSREDLRRIESTLGARMAWWREIIGFAAWAEGMLHACHPHPDPSPAVQAWLTTVIQARAALEP